MMHYNKKAAWWGAAFGLIAPFVGLFVGLQISTVLGDILTFPLQIVSWASGQVLGNWGMPMLLLGVAISMACWAIIFALVAKLFKK